MLAALAERGVDDAVTLSPPGFGAPRPDGFDATPAAYVDWLAAELRAIDGPIDLVGHDWGTGHVAGLVASHPDLVRSWAGDIIGLLHPDYVWHDMAQIWQTPDAGEEAIAAFTDGSLEDRTAIFLGLGLSPAIASDLAEGLTPTMGACVLTLYRAAAQPFLVQLADRLAGVDLPPGFAIDAVDDAYVASELAPEVIERFAMQSISLPGQGHWWMVHEPEPAADALVAFWHGLDQ